MLEKIPRPPIEDIPLSSIVLPPGCPKWIKVEKVRETMWVWQPYSDTPITVEDALEILVNVRGLLTAVVESDESFGVRKPTTTPPPKRRQIRSWKRRN